MYTFILLTWVQNRGLSGTQRCERLSSVSKHGWFSELARELKKKKKKVD